MYQPIKLYLIWKRFSTIKKLTLLKFFNLEIAEIRVLKTDRIFTHDFNYARIHCPWEEGKSMRSEAIVAWPTYQKS